MNIFYLSHDPNECAKFHVDRHTIKMILEYSNFFLLLIRVLDGTETVGLSKTGRKQTRYVLPDDRETELYSATHINHHFSSLGKAIICKLCLVVQTVD
jgi:hypothetical protein